MEKPIHALVVELQARMFAHRLKVAHVLNRADVRTSTWWRWTQGAEPKMSTLARVGAAIEAKIAEKTANADAA